MEAQAISSLCSQITTTMAVCVHLSFSILLMVQKGERVNSFLLLPLLLRLPDLLGETERKLGSGDLCAQVAL